MMRTLLSMTIIATLLPGVAAAQTAATGTTTTTTGSQACATLVQGAATGLATRIAEDQTSIQPPKSVTQLTCLSNFFNGTGLNMVTNLLDPAKLLQSVEGQLCTAVNQEWQSIVGSAQCGLTVTGFNLGFGGLGGGLMCPRLTFGGGGPPIGSVSSSGTNSGQISSYFNGQPSVPTGYPVVQSGGLY